MTDPMGEQPQDEPQQVRSSHIGALVPTHVARGTFSTGVAVLQGNHEFIVDFLLQMQQPQQVAARVILPPAVVAQFLQALTDNIQKYEGRFGLITSPGADPEPPSPPLSEPDTGTASAPEVSATPAGGMPEADPPAAPRHSAEDLYDQLRLSEDVMPGRYANAVMIGHTASEFSFDFIATFYPRSVVVQRVFLAAPNVPRLKQSLAQSFDQFQRRAGQSPPPTGGGPGSPENN